ncbi:hypothetical protein [Mechercharimyces sp. CAU 1602]|uniref:hypothetical protein n=1 Tax=Mechercharimyces sp. CAU 1602 TaxID=2973933 RepID=UPI002163EE69|nr:hypothetical protein [Mechercharimyces sp. CAU 1602]MCS1350896.1 hypothetical protein [Mechercharimyces sp. CAU 1602]
MFVKHTQDNSTSGGYYELSIEFNPTGDHQRIVRALEALVQESIIHVDKEKILDKEVKLLLNNYNCKIAIDLGGNIVDAGLFIIRVEDESDWIDICVPQNALQKIYPYRYPLLPSINPWILEVDDILIYLAKVIFQSSPFDFAMVGEEVTGSMGVGELRLQDIYKENYLLPRDLYQEFGLSEEGEEITDDLRLYRMKEEG